MNQDNSNNFTFSEIHKILVSLEKYSDHEIVQSILNEAFENNNVGGDEPPTRTEDDANNKGPKLPTRSELL